MLKIFLNSESRSQLVGILDQLLVSGGNFLTIAICAHLLPLSEQGKLTYVFSTYMGMLLLNVAAVYQGAAVRAPSEHTAYLVTLARLQIVIALFTSLAVCLFWRSFGELLGWELTLEEMALLFAFLFLQQLSDFTRRAAYIFKSASGAMFSSLAIYPARIILLLILDHVSFQSVLTIMALTAILPASVNFFVIIRTSVPAAYSWVKHAIDHLLYSRLFIFGAPLSWLWSYLPIFLLGAIEDKEQAALLASIRGISNVANVLMEQLETKVVADWARRKKQLNKNYIQNSSINLFRIGLLLWLIGFLIVTIFGEEITKFILGDTYAPYWGLLVIVWVGYGIYFIARVISIKYRVLGSNQIEFAANAIGATTALISGWVLISVLGTVGAAWVYVLIPASMVLGQLYFMQKDTK